MTEQSEQMGMHRSRITLADGRYLIFYTFDEGMSSVAEVEDAGKGASRKEPDPQPSAEEERRV